jgi:hypothetical protein
MVGTTFGHYQITGRLDKGGMGEVYVADDLNLNRKVALKFLPDAFAGDPERMARFEREARLLECFGLPTRAPLIAQPYGTNRNSRSNRPRLEAAALACPAKRGARLVPPRSCDRKIAGPKRKRIRVRECHFQRGSNSHYGKPPPMAA